MVNETGDLSISNGIQNSFLGLSSKHHDVFSEIITQSATMRSIFQYIEAIAPSQQPVLITGETGVGKELIAKAIHKFSGRDGNYVAENVAGLDDHLFTDTLFGHKKGAFTGAIQERGGLIVVAAKGTLFLDEIGDLPMTSQIKLLRLLQENLYYPLGADYPSISTARIVAATHQGLDRLVEEGRFRKDLYYRFRTHHLHIPPLRERKEDIPLLVNYFLEKYATHFGKPIPTIPSELYDLLQIYSFPGNVRELEASIIDALARQQGTALSLASFKEMVTLDHFAKTITDSTSQELFQVFFGRHLPSLEEAKAVICDKLTAEALRRAQGNQSQAASLLGISRQALNKRLQQKKSKSSP